MNWIKNQNLSACNNDIEEINPFNNRLALTIGFICFDIVDTDSINFFQILILTKTTM